MSPKVFLHRHPIVSIVALFGTVAILCVVAVGFMNIVPAIAAMLIFQSVYYRMNIQYQKPQVGYLGWAVLWGAFIVALVLSVYKPTITDWLVWWTLIISTLLSVLTMCTLIWTVYTTQTERSEKQFQQRSSQAQKVSATVKEVDQSLTLVVSNFSEMPIYDAWIGFGPYEPDAENDYKHLKRISLVDPNSEEKRQLNAAHHIEYVRDNELLQKPLSIIFRDSSSRYWHRDYSGNLNLLHGFDRWNDAASKQDEVERMLQHWKNYV